MASKQSGAEKVGFLVLGSIVAVVWGAFALFDGGDGDDGSGSDDYSTCAELATYPGTDVETAVCTDDDGDVIDYKDSEYGKAVMDLAGQ